MPLTKTPYAGSGPGAMFSTTSESTRGVLPPLTASPVAPATLPRIWHAVTRALVPPSKRTPVARFVTAIDWMVGAPPVMTKPTSLPVSTP